MNALLQNPLIKSCCVIYEMRDSKIFSTDDFISEAKDDLALVQTFFDVEEKTAAIVAVLLCEQISGNKFDVYRTMRYMGFQPIEYLLTNTILTEFKKKGWLIPNRQAYEAQTINDYSFSKEVMNAVLNNDKELLEIIIPDDIVEAMFKIFGFIKNILSGNESDFIIDVILTYVSKFRSFSVIDSIFENKQIDYEEKVILFYMMSNTYLGVEEFDLDYDLEKFAVDPSFPYVFKNKVRSGKSILFKEGFLVFNSPFLADFSAVSLGERISDQLQYGKPDSDAKKPFLPKLTLPVKPEDIIEKKLFFNETQNQIEEVFQLTSDAYDDIITRFTEQGLQPGLTMLFHGDAGTGKTELVKQIAKQNNRVIIMVDLSLLHNMFIGESEKNIRRVFKEYREAVAHFERTPIMLFNEADAIFSKRNVVQKSVDQMFNSVQNMLLQELEDFNGIFIATTNMLINMDSAFDRRILYKLNFEKPDKTTRFSILKEQFPIVEENFLRKVSVDHSLTGGQIDNVKKRCLTEQLLFGSETSNPEKFLFYVEQEMNFRKTDKTSIGFS
jgi:hypothetical protein